MAWGLNALGSLLARAGARMINVSRVILGACWRKVTPVDARNFGYDLEGENEAGQQAQFEVKGCTKEYDIKNDKIKKGLLNPFFILIHTD